METVDFFVCGGQMSRLFHFRVDCLPRKQRKVDVRKAADLYIAETEKGKMGADGSHPAVGDVGKYRPCRAVILVVEVSALQNFSEFQRHHCPCGDCLPAFHITGKILAKVQHCLPGGGADKLFYRQGFHCV